MIKTKQQLKSIFVTGYVPTQQDYEDLLDSLESQGEGLQLASIDEAIGGTSNMRVITPLLLKTYIDRLVKASVSEDGDNLNKLRTLIANLENWKNTLTNADADSIVNTYEEMKSFFASVPEGATLPTELAKRVNRSESLTTAFSGAITGTYNNNNETLLKFIDVVHTTQQTSFTLTLQNANNCNLDLRLKFFNNLILNVAVIMADGTTIAAGANIPVLSTATNVLLNISGWGGNYYVVFESRIEQSLVGDYKYSARAASHYGWLICQGQAVSRTTYANLFSVIGTNFGVGDNSTTFNLPDPQGRVPIGIGTGLTARTLGAKGGSETHTLTTAEMPSHNHGVTDSGHAHVSPVYDGTNGSLRAPNSTSMADDYYPTIPTYTAYTGISINNTGGGAPHNNMPPFLAIGNLFIHI